MADRQFSVAAALPASSVVAPIKFEPGDKA